MLWLNPVALRKAKTRFGLSECKRVNISVYNISVISRLLTFTQPEINDTQVLLLLLVAPGNPSILLALMAWGSESESELFTGDTSKDNHSPGPVFREVSP